MADRPVLFSGPMVRAILDGKKTQTRRIVEAQGSTMSPELMPNGKTTGWRTDVAHQFGRSTVVMCPYGRPGDRLWVRETHALDTWWPERGEANILFRATDPRMGDAPEHIVKLNESGFEWANRQLEKQRDGIPVWQPSIHMPRWASRITLEVTSVRVERLQDITNDDADAEGVDELDGEIDEVEICRCAAEMGEPPSESRVWFRVLWDSINGKHAPWAENPWLWVVSFRRVEPS